MLSCLAWCHGTDSMCGSTWGYELAAIVAALEQYCTQGGRDPRATYIWICFACINQHRVKAARDRGESVPPEAFRQEFESRVAGTGHVLSLLSPWSDPANLKRVWCLFEILMVLLKGSQCRFEIIMPPSEQRSFQQALEEQFDSIEMSLCKLDVEKAQASVEADGVAIKGLVRSTMGFVEVNKAIMGVLGTAAWCRERAVLEPSWNHLD